MQRVFGRDQDCSVADLQRMFDEMELTLDVASEICPEWSAEPVSGILEDAGVDLS